MFVINCFRADAVIYGGEVVGVEVSCRISTCICHVVLAACCNLGSDV